jgi:hypothetical protein
MDWPHYGADKIARAVYIIYIRKSSKLIVVRKKSAQPQVALCRGFWGMRSWTFMCPLDAG